MRLLVFQKIMSAVERFTFGNDRRTSEFELRVDRDLQRGRENGVLLLPCLVVEIELRNRVIQFLPLQPRLDGVVHVVAGEKFLVDDLVDVPEGGQRRADVLVDLVGLRLVLPAAPLKIGADRRADDAGGQDEAADLAEPELRWLFRGLFRDLGSLASGIAASSADLASAAANASWRSRSLRSFAPDRAAEQAVVEDAERRLPQRT